MTVPLNPELYDNSWEQLFRLRVFLTCRKNSQDEKEYYLIKSAEQVRNWNRLIDSNTSREIKQFYTEKKHETIVQTIKKLNKIEIDEEDELRKFNDVILSKFNGEQDVDIEHDGTSVDKKTEPV